ncbi:hypothetical protein AGMMS49928_13570 [Spirochaetia bacterium]|nr:hypothetical protein AGMMS49928_13570 [Spirochaetia bacterium]
MRGGKKSGFRRFRVLAAVVLGLILGAGLYALFRPRPVWYVEAPYAALWRQMTASSSLPQSWRIITFENDPAGKPSRPLPQRFYGFRITANSGTGAGMAPRGITALYPMLSQAGEYRGALALAVNPWMVFRRRTDPPLSRSRAETAEGEGVLFIPGKDRYAAAAWTAQLLQEQPGVFPPAGDLWVETAESLFRGSLFQRGALTYGWADIWSRLDDVSPSWVYAPLSRVEDLPGYRTSLWEADRFPEKDGWNEFGLQAQILWAIPFGNEKNTPSRAKRLGDPLPWLRDAGTQTAIADALGWIPAHRQGKPYNPIAHSAQLAWLSSSYIWEAELPQGTGDW